MESYQPEQMPEEEIPDEFMIDEQYLECLRTKNIENSQFETNFQEKITNINSIIHNLSETKNLSQKKEEMDKLKNDIKK